MTERNTRGQWLLGESLVGKQCGSLEVIAQAERPENNSIKIRGTWWRCRCKCGKEIVLPRQYITQKTFLSCGCKKRKSAQPKAAISADVGREKKTPEQVAQDKAKAGRARAEQIKGKCDNFRMPMKLSKVDERSLNSLSSMIKCAECGKTFERISYDWVYKRRNAEGHVRWFCSWKCLRAADAKKCPLGNYTSAKALR